MERLGSVPKKVCSFSLNVSGYDLHHELIPDINMFCITMSFVRIFACNNLKLLLLHTLIVMQHNNINSILLYLHLNNNSSTAS